MQCRCGNTMKNVPEHLSDLATWVCQKCTNTAPKAQAMTFDEAQLEARRESMKRGRRKAA